MRQSCLVRYIYTRTILNLPVPIQGNSKSVPLIYTPGLNQTDFLIMEIGIIAVALALFHNHALVHKELVQIHMDIASTLVADTCITLFQGL